MNKYELALVVTAKIDDAARADVVEKAKGYIARSGGEIVGVEEWGKKRLAYEIQYQREGYYYFIHFEAEPTAPAMIERDVRIMDNILRYLIVRQEDDFVMPQLESAPVEAEAAEETVDEAETEVPEEVDEAEETAEEPGDETAEEAAEETAEESGDVTEAEDEAVSEETAEEQPAE